ncbi:MAG: DegV family protein [Bacilli bacterium]|nr:DegV family protein [Bacilli bacterium]
MAKIVITTDSTCAISQEEAKSLGIFVLPLNVIVDGQEYHDGIDINNEQLAKYMRGGSDIKTSTPTLFEMENFFDNVLSQGYDKVIHFTISSKLTSIFSMFTVNCKEKYGDKVVIIDTLSVCSFMGNIVLHAKMLVDEGKDADYIINDVKSHIGVEDIFFVPESLTFLKRGGRVSPTVAAIGNMLGIKPVLRFVDGAIDKDGTTRALKKYIPTIVDYYKSKNYSSDEYEIHIVEFDCGINTKLLLEYIEKEFSGYTIKVTPISINVCAHCGPGTIGIGFTKKA